MGEYEKDLLFRYASVRTDTMEECEELGFNIKESIHKVIIMQRLAISSEDMMIMIDNFGSEEAAYQETREYIHFLRVNIKLENEIKSEFVPLLKEGHRLTNISKAFVAADLLELSLSDIISKDYQEFTETDFSVFSSKDTVSLKTLLNQYSVEDEVIINYISSKNIVISDLQQMLEEHQQELGFISSSPMVASAADSEGTTTTTQTKEYPSAAFHYRDGINETVDLNSGALIYEEFIASLLGVNGESFDLVLQYNSSMTNDYDMSGKITVKTEDILDKVTGRWTTKTTTTKENITEKNSSGFSNLFNMFTSRG